MGITLHNRDLIGISNRYLARVKLINKLVRVNKSLMNWRSLEGNYIIRVIIDIYINLSYLFLIFNFVLLCILIIS